MASIDTKVVFQNKTILHNPIDNIDIVVFDNALQVFCFHLVQFNLFQNLWSCLVREMGEGCLTWQIIWLSQIDSKKNTAGLNVQILQRGKD